MEKRIKVDDGAPTFMQRFIWLNIVVQALFPLATAFTPAIADEGAEQRFLPPLSSPVSLRTQVYTLKEGENVTDVAKKYNMTTDALRRMNQLRTFAHGFDHLQEGDELDVPLTPLPEIEWRDEKAAGDPLRADSPRDLPEQKVATAAVQAGHFLAAGADGDQAIQMGRSLVAGEAGNQLQQWLSRFGTARVQLNTDEQFSLKNSAFDLLAPLYDKGSNMFFTQGSLHRTDDRTQANLGFGFRYFASQHMLGGNLFSDYDLSRDHARAGIGVEYWRDYLKLGANSYLRLTGWRDSPDEQDYEERPANGWDIRAQAWLPALPQLGGKLTFEQYYGDEVALFGKDNRQDDPHAITAGITYTPVPLLTFTAEQRQGQSGQNDTRFGLEMNYQPGVPWHQQVNPGAVAAMRSLAGSRYDLVERNNNIVLEYRKKDIIRLRLAEAVTGYAGEQKSLGVSVNSSHGLSHIDWSASSLIAAGGKIVQNAGGYDVVLPAYQFSANAVNTYTISGIAVDTKGNHSARSETRVSVQAPEVNRTNSMLTPLNSQLPADGKSTQKLTLTLRDSQEQPVDISTEEIALHTGTLKGASISAPSRKSPGIYTVTVTAGTHNETIVITPEIRGITLGSAKVIIDDVMPDTTNSSFTASPETIVADNNTVSTLILTARDAKGNLLSGLKKGMAFVVKENNASRTAAGNVTLSPVSESSGPGLYTATLKGQTAGKYTVTPEYNGNALEGLGTTVTLTTLSPEQTTSTISTDSASYFSGSDISVTVMLNDAADHPVTGASSLLTTSTVSVPNAELKAGGEWKENKAGVYTALYRAKTPGAGLVAALKLNGWSTASESSTYVITASRPSQTTSLINTDKTDYKVGENIVITITLKDTSGDAVSGESATLDNAVVVPNADKTGAWKETGSGIYTRAFTARTTGINLKATLKMTDWSGTVESSEYEIVVNTVSPKGVVVNGYTFAANAGFPTTGFAGANFTFELRNGESLSDYTWESDASWVTVNNDGKVVLQGNGGNQKVTITGTPKNRTGDIVSYSFTVKGWYVSLGNASSVDWAEANQSCNNLSGYTLPSIPQLSGAPVGVFGYYPRGTLGGLWSEWGNMTNYPGSYPTRSVWSSDSHIDGSGITHVYLSDLGGNDSSWNGGTVTQNGNGYAVCRREL